MDLYQLATHSLLISLLFLSEGQEYTELSFHSFLIMNPYKLPPLMRQDHGKCDSHMISKPSHVIYLGYLALG